MGAWYRVIKTINGCRYVYEQRTWREGKRVRTENRYIGPAEGRGGSLPERPARASNFDGVIPSVFYHGAREDIEGPPRASEEGTFGPGLYLTTKERAAIYARYGARIAAKIVEGEGNPDEPEYNGTVHAFDVRALRLKTLSHKQYLDLCEPLDEARAATPEARAKLQAILAAEGYDGLYIIDDKRHELVVFPGLMDKIKPLTTTIKDENS